jgi:putative ABC transport system permease protein
VRENLNLPENPVDEYVRVGDEWMKVIGLAEEKGQLFGQNQDNFAIIPYSTMRSIAGNQNELDMAIQLTLGNLDQMEAVQDQVTALLRNAHDIAPGEDDDFQVRSSEQLTDTFNNILGSVTFVMGGIVGISLLVGGIGIMNIMLVSVTERTKEIGICKAIGAKRHQILLQFLFESLLLCLLGGLIGLTIGYGIGLAASAAIPDFPRAVVPLWAVLLSFLFSAMVGLVFGIMPAAKAANLDPIDALRYE